MPQQDILTVTLNPAVDVSTSVAQVVAGPKLRCSAPRVDPGGGGVNVARTVCKLGGSARALVAVGGTMGDRLVGLLGSEGVPVMPVKVSGETRQSFAVTDNSTGGQFRFSVPGQALSAQDAEQLLSGILAQAQTEGFVVISGSVAPGLPVEFQSQIINAVASQGAKAIIDTSSQALDELIANPTAFVHVLRIDQDEAAEAARHPMTTLDDSITFAADLVSRGVAKTVVTGRGAEGSVLVTEGQQYICQPPVVAVRSKVGAGDSFLGAMTLALARGETIDRALQWGVAAASATVSTEGTALCEAKQVQARFAQCKTRAL